MSTSAFSMSLDTARVLASTPVAPRARALLTALHTHWTQALAAPLAAALVDLEQALLQQAERARNGQLQAEWLAERRHLGEHGSAFAPGLMQALAAEIAGLRQPRRLAATPPDAGPATVHTLTLVDDADIDRDIVLHEIARRATVRDAAALQLLAQRFGALAGAPAFEIDQLPLGPHALCRALRAVGDGLGLAPDTQLRLYRAFEHQVLDRHGELIERSNLLLAREGVLPGLVYLPYLARPAVAVRARPAPAAGRVRSPLPGQGLNAAAGPGRPPRRHADAAMPVRAPGPGQAPWPGPEPAGDGPGPADAPGTAAAPDRATLQRLLAAARRSDAAQGALPAPADTGVAATPAQALTPAALGHALAMLQAAPAQRTEAGARGVHELRRRALALARAQHGPQAGLARQDADTFDLLGLLYGELARELGGGPAAGLMARLQVPVLRAALEDPAFFEHARHPARELLNTLAESGATWLADDEADAPLRQALDQAVDRVVGDYQGDAAVFVAANEAVRTHCLGQARRAEVAERRHVEAARGRERLETAKRHAAAQVEQLCAQAAPPPFVQTLLRQAWADVLTLGLLRHGEDSAEAQARRQLTARIVEVTGRAAGGAPDAALGQAVEQALLQVGHHPDEAGAIARRLSTPGGEDRHTSRSELSARLSTRSRLGEHGEERPREDAPAPRTADEQAWHARLRALPFGTWFEFVTNQQGDVRRQRLSWFSPVTDHALFVNPRGQKVGEPTLDALARLMASGQARLLAEDRTRPIDRAWQAALRLLRTLSGEAASSGPQAAA